MVQLLAGFQVSQALYVTAKLGLADALIGGPRAVEDLAAIVGAAPAPLRRLLRTLSALGIVSQTSDDHYAVTPLGETLASGTPGSMRDLAVMWMETHYLPFSELIATVRDGRPAAERYYEQPFFEWLAPQPEMVATFSRAMANLTDGIKLGAIASYDFSGAGTVVDVGGADGTLLAFVLANNPSATGVLLDLPHVVPAAEKLLAERGLSQRARVVGGDFFAEVPAGGDLYVESFILHDWNDEECVRILENVRRAASPSGRLVMFEFVVPPGDVPHMAKMIDLTMLAMLTGCERTEPEWRALLARAGWRLERVVDTVTPLSVLEASIA